eukprot:scaffold144682_cov32-Attheya_sp.AAC.2
MVDTDGWIWMSQFDRAQDGRRAWQELCAHYDGPGETQKRIMQARASISELYYKSEASFSFEKFATKLREAYAVMEDNDETVLQQTQVHDMCDHITCEHTAVVKQQLFKSEQEVIVLEYFMRIALLLQQITFPKLSDSHSLNYRLEVSIGDNE